MWTHHCWLWLAALSMWSYPLATASIWSAQELNCSLSDWHSQDLPYHGLECHDSNIWPQGACPMHGACIPECSRCTNWRRGLVPLATQARWANERAEQQRAKELACDSSLWNYGTWSDLQPSSTNITWVPSGNYTQCSPGLPARQELYQCLKGKRVFVMGDSMIRPLFGHIMAYLRGQEAYVDHLFHEPGGYYMANGTHDVFVECEFLPSLHQAASARSLSHIMPSTPENDWDLSRTVQVQYYWAPHLVHIALPNTISGVVTHLPAMHEHFGTLDGAEIIVAGSMYHENGDFETYRHAMLEYFKQLASLGRRVEKLFWIGSVPSENDHLDAYTVRNWRMRVFIDLLNDHSLRGEVWAPKQSFFVDNERMYQLRNGKFPRSDYHHFQCNKHGAYPHSIVPDGAGMPPDLDCRDPFNRNVIMSVMKVACNL